MASERNQTSELTLLLAEILHILGLADVVALSPRVRVVYLAVTHFLLEISLIHLLAICSRLPT